MSMSCPTPGHGATARPGMCGTGEYTTPGIAGTSVRRGPGARRGRGVPLGHGDRRGDGVRHGRGDPAGDPAGIMAGRLRLLVQSRPRARRVLTHRHMQAAADVRRQAAQAQPTVIAPAHPARRHAPAIWDVAAQEPPARLQTPAPAHIAPPRPHRHRVPAIWAAAE